MPYLSIQTNVGLDEPQQQTLLRVASSATAELLGKPESAVCVALEQGTPMLFAGTDAPCVMATLVALGLNASVIPVVADALTARLADALGVPGERFYLAFESPPRSHWAVNGKPFG